MQRLLLLRHATAAAQGPEPGDRGRPLSARGLKEAAVAARWLLDNDAAPQVVLCSPSVRTRETWDVIAPTFPDAAVHLHDDLYLGSVRAYLDAIDASEAATVALIGHNPTCAALAGEFAGNGAAGAFRGHFPPAAICVAQRNGLADGWRLKAFVTPADAAGTR